MVALLILTMQSKKDEDKARKKYFDFYLKNTKYINNWDLVDVTCRDVVGNYLLNKDKRILYKMAKSKNIWEKRIAIISTFAFFKYKLLDDSLKIAEILLYDEHDLIRKAVGWTLREVGKVNLDKELEFLNKYYKTMPRTTLRYAIEKFPRKQRDFYLGRV